MVVILKVVRFVFEQTKPSIHIIVYYSILYDIRLYYTILYYTLLYYTMNTNLHPSSASKNSRRAKAALGGTTCLTLLVEYGLICFMRCL